MAFKVHSNVVKPGIARLTLSGELDAGTSLTFRSEIEKIISADLRRVVLDVAKLEYMASAGVRVLVFARQKMGPAVEIYVVCPQDAVKDTLVMTGMQHALTILDQDDPAVVEA